MWVRFLLCPPFYFTGEMLYWKSVDPNNKLDTPIMYIEESAANELKVQYEKA